MTKSKPEKIELTKTHKDLYTATLKVKEVAAARAVFLSLEGKGEPGGTAFESAIQKLYSLAYTLKFMLKNAGIMDFSVGRLECLWNGEDLENTPRSEWRWQLLVRIPDAISATMLKQARAETLKKRELDTSGVVRWSWTEGRCVQVMHVGPYDDVGRSFEALAEYAQSRGEQVTGPCHEIYISDPRRVVPAKLKTIVRMPLAK